VLNDPLPAEHAMALHHGFEVLQPKDVPNGKVRRNSVCCKPFDALAVSVSGLFI